VVTAYKGLRALFRSITIPCSQQATYRRSSQSLGRHLPQHSATMLSPFHIEPCRSLVRSMPIFLPYVATSDRPASPLRRSDRRAVASPAIAVDCASSSHHLLVVRAPIVYTSYSSPSFIYTVRAAPPVPSHPCHSPQPPSSSMTTFTLAAVHPTSPEASKSVATRPLSFLPVPPLIAGPSDEFPPHQDHKMGASSPPPLDGALARMFSPSVELPSAALSAWHCGLECHRSGPDPMAISRASGPCGTMQRTPPYRATGLAIGE
jgi:hypothetical protein